MAKEDSGSVSVGLEYQEESTVNIDEPWPDSDAA
jgi:hypothetical protein